VVVAQGHQVRWFTLEGREVRTTSLPFIPGRLSNLGGCLAFQRRSSDHYWAQAGGTAWTQIESPQGLSGEGVWAAGGDRLYHISSRSATLLSRAVSAGVWRPFMEQAEEIENPVDLVPDGRGLLVLNQDPPGAVRLDVSGRSTHSYELTRDKVWPLQRLVFAAPLDYLRPRRCETPQRIWASLDGRFAVLFTTEDGRSPRLAVFFPVKGDDVTVKEGLLPLRSEGLKRGAVIADFLFLQDGTSLLTSDRGGLWRFDRNVRLIKEWEPLPPYPPTSQRLATRWGPWLLLVSGLLSLIVAAWPQDKNRVVGNKVPRRAWAMGAASVVVPGLGQALQRRWGWSVFWFVWVMAWAALFIFLTARLKAGGFVAPATYIECALAGLAFWFFSGLQAFQWEAGRKVPREK
jgi:hypothetical protein